MRFPTRWGLSPFSSKPVAAKALARTQQNIAVACDQKRGHDSSAEPQEIDVPRCDRLTTLPETVLLHHVLTFLDGVDLSRFARLNKRSKRISYDSSLWRALYVRDFFAPRCTREWSLPSARDSPTFPDGPAVGTVKSSLALHIDLKSSLLSTRQAYIVRAVQARQRRNHRTVLRELGAYKARVGAIRSRLGPALFAVGGLYGNMCALCACLAVFFSLLSAYLLENSAVSATSLMIPWWIFFAYLYVCGVLGAVMVCYRDFDYTFPRVYVHLFWKTHAGFIRVFMYETCDLNTSEADGRRRVAAALTLYFAGLTSLLCFASLIPSVLEDSHADASWSLIFVPLYVFCLLLLLVRFVPERQSLQDVFLEALPEMVFVVGPLTAQVVLIHVRCLGVITSSWAVVLIPFFIFQAFFIIFAFLYELEKANDLCWVACVKWFQTLIIVVAPLIATQVMLIENLDTSGQSGFKPTTIFAPSIAVFGLMALYYGYYSSLYERLGISDELPLRSFERDPGTYEPLRVPRRRADSHRRDEPLGRQEEIILRNELQLIA